VTAGVLLAVVALVFGAGGWFYAGEIRKGALDPVPPTEPSRRGGGRLTCAA
jgi:hypothetical protein